MSRKLHSYDEKLMRGLGLQNPEQLDALLVQPLSEDAANHSGPLTKNSSWQTRCTRRPSGSGTLEIAS